MEIDEIREIILSWDEILSPSLKTRIHYQSVRNFVRHFEEIENLQARRVITDVLSEYIEVVKQNDYIFDPRPSNWLAKNYVVEIGNYYRRYANFSLIMSTYIIVLCGLFCDLLLLIFGILSKFHYLPVVTIVLILYHIYLRLYKGSNGRLYGISY